MVQVPEQVVNQKRLGQDGGHALAFREFVVLPPDEVQQSDDRSRTVALDDLASQQTSRKSQLTASAQCRRHAAGGDCLLGRVPDGGIAPSWQASLSAKKVSRAPA